MTQGKPYFRVLPSDAPKFRDALFAISDREFRRFFAFTLPEFARRRGKEPRRHGRWRGRLHRQKSTPIEKSGEALNKARLLVIGQQSTTRKTLS